MAVKVVLISAFSVPYLAEQCGGNIDYTVDCRDRKLFAVLCSFIPCSLVCSAVQQSDTDFGN